MGNFLYHLIIGLFSLFLRISSYFNKKAQAIVEGRKNTFQKLKAARNSEDKVIWIHCASLGEFEQGRPLIEKIKKDYPQYKAFLSFFSPSGYEIQKKYEFADCVFYLPADLPKNAEEVLTLINPSLVLFIKYEFWFNFVNSCFKKGIPIFSVSTILRPNQSFFKWYGRFYLKILTMFTHFFVQNSETKELLINHGIEDVSLSGDTRFDRVSEIAANPMKIKGLSTFKGNSKLIVLGSTWPEDIDLWKDFINNSEDLKFVIAPHNIDESNLQYIEKQIKLPVFRYSNENMGNGEVLLIDNIGMLSSIYSYADIAYVGGAFGEGLHNILEPATFGIPILFGKGADNFKYLESIEIVENKGGYEIKDPGNLKEIMTSLLSDEALLESCGRNARNYIESNLGATDKVMKHLKHYLEK